MLAVYCVGYFRSSTYFFFVFAMDCAECCNKILDTDLYSCDGFCRRSFHTSCIDLEASFLVSMRQSTQLKWFCSECNEKLNEILKNDLHQFLIDHIQVPIMNAIKKMSDSKSKGTLIDKSSSANGESSKQPKEIVKKALGNANQRKTSIDLSLNRSSSDPKTTAKRNLRSASRTTKNSPTVGTPSSVPDDVFIAKNQETPKSSNPSKPAEAKAMDKLVVVPPRFWLFFGRLQPDTSIEDVRGAVTECMGTTDIKVLPLFRQPVNQEYISFKVGIPLDMKDKALAPETWPNRLFVKEFNNKPRKNANFLRKPLRQKEPANP